MVKQRLTSQQVLIELERIVAVLKVHRLDPVAMYDFERLVKGMSKADRVATGETLADLLREASK